jgi:hypothetical protein
LFAGPQLSYEKICYPDRLACCVDFEKNYRGQFCVLAREGLFGYWLFDLEENNGDYEVKVRFIGDLLYFSIYM